MRIRLNHQALKAAGDTKAKLTVLKGQVAFILTMGEVSKAMMGQHRLSNIKSLNAHVAVESLNESTIKSFLAQKFNVPTDNPKLVNYTNQYVQFIHENMLELDFGYEALFKHVDMVGSMQDYFEINSAKMKAAWNVRAPGEKTQLRTAVTEDGLQVKMIEMSDGIQLLDRWLEYNQFYKIEGALSEFYNTYYQKKAEFHYGLFTNLGAEVDFDVSGHADDVIALNAASGAMDRSLEGKGLPGGVNAGKSILVAPEYQGKVGKMLSATLDSELVKQGTVVEPLTARINQVVSSTKVPKSKNGYYLIQHGGRIQKADWKPLTTESGRDILVSAEQLVGVGQYNCAVGDTDQVLFVPFK